MVAIKNYYANKKNYGSKRSTSKIKYIVIHYTGNDGDLSINNAKYFKNNVVEVSAHYFVDDTTIYRSVPDNYVAWHCGAKKYYHACRNTSSIGIEMCDTLKNGKYELSAKTKANTIDLVRSLMKKYNIPIENVIRHYDVTHKNCPAYFVNEAKWATFKQEIVGVNKKAFSGMFPDVAVAYYVKDKKGNKQKKYRYYLQKGDEGLQVRRLQMFLNWAIDANLDVDGDFGKKTLAAVKKFQKAYGLTVDGLFGKASLAKAKTIRK